MIKASNRYLTLAGAPYSPQKPNAQLSLTNYFTAAATSLAIFGAAYVNPSVNKHHLLYLGEGLLGSALAMAFIVGRKKEEAKKISSHPELLLIDTAPDKSTPPTSPDILTRVTGLKNEYKNRSSLRIDSLNGAAIDLMFGGLDASQLLKHPSPHLYAFFMPFFTIHAVDVFMRFRQLNKISNLEWTITDQGNANRNFQNEEAESLAKIGVLQPSGIR